MCVVCACMCQDGLLSVSRAEGTACAEAHGRELGVLTTVGYVWSRGWTGSKEMSGREAGLSIKASVASGVCFCSLGSKTQHLAATRLSI